MRDLEKRWGHSWRSSNWFIFTTLLLAIFNDEMLFSFMAPLLPYILSERLGMDPALTQRYTSIFLAEGALASVLSSPFIGSISDRVSSKKLLLLIMLGLALGSTLCLALATSIPGLLVGRLFQSIVSNAMWIVGMATLADNIGSEHMGKIAGAVSTVAAAGGCSGPIIAGVLFGVGGYWAAWSGAVIFLAVDIILRLLMIEKSKLEGISTEDGPHQSESSDPLLGDRQHIDIREIKGWHFYVRLMQERRFVAGIFCFFVHSILVTGFISTVAPHARDALHWGVFPVGLLFAALQGPGIVLAPAVGWLKDRVGSRSPTAIGFFSVAPLQFVAGVAGEERFNWTPTGLAAKVVYATSMALTGCLMCLLYGVGTMEATETVDTIESINPGIFGPHGGYSRTISVTTISWMMGSLVIPVVAGVVIEEFGYFEFQCILGFICVIAGGIAVSCLGSGTQRDQNSARLAQAV